MNEEVKKVNKIDATSGENRAASLQNPSGVVIMTGVAKKTIEQKRKGELIEQNQDGLEVSSFSIEIIVYCALSFQRMLQVVSHKRTIRRPTRQEYALN